MENDMSIDEDSSKNFKSNKKLKKCENSESLIKTKNKEPIHYYYTDPLQCQWCFIETRGSTNDYYYRCSTSKCTVFGMINKYKENAPFILTKAYSIPYYEHNYSLNKYSEINFNIPEKDFVKAFKKSKKSRISAIKDFLSHTDYVSLEATLAYFEGKGIKNNIEDYKNDIIKALSSQKDINSTKGKVLENLNIMKINGETNVCMNILYTIKEANETKTYSLFYIITEKMRLVLIILIFFNS